MRDLIVSPPQQKVLYTQQEALNPPSAWQGIYLRYRRHKSQAKEVDFKALSSRTSEELKAAQRKGFLLTTWLSYK